MRSLPRAPSRRIPIVPTAIGLMVVVVVVIAGVLIAGGIFGGDGEVIGLPETIIQQQEIPTPVRRPTTGPAVSPGPTNTTRPTRTPSASAGVGDNPPTGVPISPSTPIADVPTPPPFLRSSGRIVFSSDRDGNDEIYVAEADGSVLTLLSNHPAADTRPSWSPSGTKVIFVSDRAGSQDIFVMNADGTDQVNLTKSQSLDSDPDWSPDGTRVAFSSHREGGFNVFVMNSDGSGTVRLSDNDGKENGGPAWSPDGSKIAFTSYQGNLDIFVMNADGSGETRLTTHPGDDAAPAWSPDGSRVAYHSNRHGASEIYLINSDGTGETRLTNDNTPDFNPSWSGDGTEIMFESERDGLRELYTINADGTGLTRITNGGGSSPAWSNTTAPVALVTPTPTSVPTHTPSPRPTRTPSPTPVPIETTLPGSPVSARDLDEFCSNVSLQIDSWDLPPTLPPSPVTGSVTIRYRIPLGAQFENLFFSVDTSVITTGAEIMAKYPDAAVDPNVNYLNNLNPYETIPMTVDGLWHVRSIALLIPSESQFMAEGQPWNVIFNWTEFPKRPYEIFPPSDYAANFKLNAPSDSSADQRGLPQNRMRAK